MSLGEEFMDFTVSEGSSAASLASGNPLWALGGNIISGIFGSSSAKSANKQSAKLMREQMAWQERMANTMHQREVADLRAAGLNPILSATKGYGGTMPGNVSAAPVLDTGAAGRASALAISRAMAELDLIKAQTANVEAQTATELQRPGNVSMDTNLKRSNAMNYEATEVLAKNQGLLVAAQKVAQELVNEINKSSLAAVKKEELLKLIAERQITQADAERAKTDKEFFKSEVGSIVRTASLILQALGIKPSR